MGFRTLTECRFCAEGPLWRVLDLGSSPVANNLCASKEEALNAPRYPLQLVECPNPSCGLLQLSIAVDRNELFDDYTYSTPDSPVLREHYENAWNWILAGAYNPPWADEMMPRQGTAVEIGSNNSQFLVGLPYGRLVGVDPTSVALTAPHLDRLKNSKLHLIPDFFGPKVVEYLLEANTPADLIATRHCFAHIDDVHEVLRGVKKVLAPDGLLYIENAYAFDTLVGEQFDQIYHEHLSYLSVKAVDNLLQQYGMRVTDVNLSDIHGGTVMMLATNTPCAVSSSVGIAKRLESQADLYTFKQESQDKIRSIRSSAIRHGSEAVLDAYGASAKAVTRFAAAGITHEKVRLCIDDSPLKQGKFLPGSAIPIVSRDEAWGTAEKPTYPDYCMLTAWNYAKVLKEREKHFLESGGRFV